MNFKKEVIAVIKTTDEKGRTANIFENDSVIYRVNNKRYIGVINQIGIYKENDNAMAKNALWMLRLEGEAGYVSEIIKLSDVSYIWRIPTNFNQTDESLSEKGNVTEILTNLGYNKEEKYFICKKIKEMVDVYKTSDEDALARVVFALENGGYSIEKIKQELSVLEMSKRIIKVVAEFLNILRKNKLNYG